METFQRRFMYFRYRPLPMFHEFVNRPSAKKDKKNKQTIKQASKQAIKQDKIIKNRPYH